MEGNAPHPMDQPVLILLAIGIVAVAALVALTATGIAWQFSGPG